MWPGAGSQCREMPLYEALLQAHDSGPSHLRNQGSSEQVLVLFKRGGGGVIMALDLSESHKGLFSRRRGHNLAEIIDWN